MPGARLSPTLFDKLTADLEFEGLQAEGVAPERASSAISAPAGGLSADRLERWSEQALKAAVRRELAWLFNTNHLGATADLGPYPQVRTSVLNYGVPDLAGKANTRRALLGRAKELRDAILAFEPRLNPRSLSVEVSDVSDHDNAVTFVVRGDVVGAVQALMVQYRTEVEVDTGAATVKG